MHLYTYLSQAHRVQCSCGYEIKVSNDISPDEAFRVHRDHLKLLRESPSVEKDKARN
jgi:hypothetical protein